MTSAKTATKTVFKRIQNLIGFTSIFQKMLTAGHIFTNTKVENEKELLGTVEQGQTLYHVQLLVQFYLSLMLITVIPMHLSN